MKNRTLWTFVITSVALFMVTLDNLVVTTAIPMIRTDLGASLESLEWTVNAYTLTFAVLLLTGAALGDRFGRRRVFSLGVGIFTAGSVAAALAPSIELLNLARAVQGLGGAIVLPLTLTILSAAVPADKRGLALGAWGGISGLAVALGPVVGGAIVQGISWQWIFWLNVPIGIALVPLAFTRLTESHGPAARLDLRGLALSAAGLFGIVWGLVRGNALGWASTADPRRTRRGCRAAGRLRRLGTAGREPDAADAVLPQPDVHPREHRVAAHVLRDVRLDLPPVAVLPDRAGLLAARLGHAHPALDARADVRRADRGRPLGQDQRQDAHRHRPRPQALGLGWLSLISTPTTPYSEFVAPFILAGVGMGLFFAPVANVVLSAVRPSEEGQASGANNAIRELGGVFGVAVLASVFARLGGYQSGNAFVDGMNPAMLIGATVVAVGAAAAFAIPKRRAAKKPQEVVTESVPELVAA